jgi:flagellar motor component MotA
MVLRFIVGMVLVCAVFALGMVAAGAGFLIFLELISATLIIFPPVFILFICFSPVEIKQAFTHVFSHRRDKDADYSRDIVLFAALQRGVILTGVIGSLIGMVAMLHNLRDAAAVGYGLAQLLLVTLYALVICLIFILPCQTVLKKKQALQEEGKTMSANR